MYNDYCCSSGGRIIFKYLVGVEWVGYKLTEIKTNRRITSKNPIQNEVEKHGKTIQKVKNRKSETYKQYKRYLIHTKIN